MATEDNQFPVYVVARELDRPSSGKAVDIPLATLLNCVQIPIAGVDQTFLPWFTSERMAQRYIRDNNLRGFAARIDTPEEAIDVLGRHGVRGVALNLGAMDAGPTCLEVKDLVRHFERLISPH